MRQDDFRRLVYFGRSGSAAYEPREELQEIHARWRLYQAREYYAYALSTLWADFSDWGVRAGGDLRPLSVDAFMRSASVVWGVVARSPSATRRYTA